MICLENVLNMSLQDVLKMSWRRLQNVLKTSWKCLEDVFQDALKTFWRRLEDDLARRLADVLKMLLQDVLKTSWKRLEDVWSRRLYWSWPRRLEDVFWRRKAKADIFVLIKTSPEDDDERRLEDVFKTSSSRQMFAGNRL